MRKNDLSAFIALLIATAVFMGAVHMKAPASRYVDKNAISGKEEALDISGAENITKAVKVLNKDGSEAGYIVTVEEAGFGGTIVMEVSVDAAKTEVLSINVTEQSETPDLGARITEDEFRAQFAGVEAPVYLPGMLVKEEAKTPVTADGLKDGVYTVESEEFDGYKDVLELTVADGKIKGIVWDSVDADGVGKSVLSEQGVYVMTEDGLTWKEQAEALAAAVIENQSVECLSLNEQGKTDAVSGVSIYVGGFVNVLTEALEQAEGVVREEVSAEPEVPEAPEQGTVVDGISGATISSTAVVNGVNRAVEFINQL